MAALPAIHSDLIAALRAAVRRRWGEGAEVDNVEQATLGGSNRTLLFDLVLPGERTRLVSREETFAGADKPFLSPAMQFRALSLAFERNLLVPRPVFAYDEADQLGPGFVSQFAAGSALPRRVLADTACHPALLRQIAHILAALHEFDIAPFEYLAAVPESGDPIAAMRYRIDSLEEAHPALELGLRWLERHPAPPRAPVVVHGDFRTGNFLVDDGTITAVLDWECCHLGSPAEDLGWLCTRSWRFGRFAEHAGGIATRNELRRAYHAAGGVDIGEDEIRWWEIFGLIRWAMFNILQGHGHVHGRRSPAYAACGRNVALMEYDLLMTLAGEYD
jgi:aminoglycoside phosphotransferase (APT) family kinase protein